MPREVRVRLSSAISVELGDRILTGRDLGSRKARRLLALLTAERGRLVPLDRIVDAVWPEGPPTDPGANVSTLVSRLRRQLGEGVLTGTGRAYGLVDRSAASVDLDEVDVLLAEAETRLDANEPALAAAGARQALAVLGQQLALVDEPAVEWVEAVRREVDALRRRARHLLSAALTPTAPAEAVEVAHEAVAADPYDERAVRDLMRALVAADRAAAALEAYQALARRLRSELGTSPTAATSQLHVAVLREAAGPGEARTSHGTPPPVTLIGRESELAAVQDGWRRAAGREGSLLLIEGEGGTGKTRLLDAAADLARRTGGLALASRCHPTERSMFLEPYVEALRPALLARGEAAVSELVRGHEAAWRFLLPDLSAVVAADEGQQGSTEVRQRRAYDAVAAVLRRLSRERPVLLSVDDLQDGGAATVDLLGHLASRLSEDKLLLMAAVRTEAVATIDRLADRSRRLRLGALPPSAVDALAAAAGLAGQGAAVMERTAGHPLSVVESLRALAAGETGVPASLHAALLGRVARLQPPERHLVHAASVLRRRLDPQLLAQLTETSELSAVHGCETLTLTGLLSRSDGDYEFANDLIQECVHESLPPALARALHRRAADLFADQPESMAEHAFAAGDKERAARGWLLAGQTAMRRSAVEDAAALYSRGLDATIEPATRARLLIARSQTSEARTAYAEGLVDIDEALTQARAARDQRVELAALRARGGDVAVGLHLPTAEVSAPLERALSLATALGDRPAEADVSARLSVLDSSRLQLTSAIRRAEATLRHVGNTSSELRVIALDALKTPLAYLGAPERLAAVTGELEPLLRQRERSWLLQWVVFESSFVDAAHGRWEVCRARVEEAQELNRRTGYPAYGGYFEAHLGWFARLAGNLDVALEHGRSAVEMTSSADHPWWYAGACGQLAATLVEAGDLDGAEQTARRGLDATGEGTAEAGRLRCAAPLALVSGDDADWRLARDLLLGVEAPQGHAWVVGADCYLLVARAALARGALDEVAAPLAALGEATAEHWTPVREALDRLLGQRTSATR